MSLVSCHSSPCHMENTKGWCQVDSTPFPKEGPSSLRIQSRVSRLMPLESMPHGKHQGMGWSGLDSIPEGTPAFLKNPKSCLSSHATRVHATWKRPRDGLESGLDSIRRGTPIFLENPKSCLSSHAIWKTLKDGVEWTHVEQDASER